MSAMNLIVFLPTVAYAWQRRETEIWTNRNGDLSIALIKLQNTFMSNNKEISEALRDETSNCLPT